MHPDPSKDEDVDLCYSDEQSSHLYFAGPCSWAGGKLMAHNFVDQLIRGDIQREGRANLRHPYVKFAYVFIPLILGAICYLFRMRGVEFETSGLAVVVFLLLLGQSLDFRDSGFHYTVRWSV